MTDQLNQAAIDRINAIANADGVSRFEAYEAEVTRDPVTGRINGGKSGDDDTGLTVTFTVEEVFSKAATFDAGGIPTYVPMEFVSIVIPGNKNLTVHTPVTDFYMWRFPKEYDAFKAGHAEIVDGTPLAEWPLMSKGQIRELNYHGVRTVEQLAGLSDSTSGVLRGFFAMKRKAADWLAARKGTAEAQATEVRDQKLDEANAKIAQLEALMAKFLASVDPVAPKAKAEKAPPSQE